MVTRKHSPLQLDVLLHESGLRRVIGSPRIMAAQMRALAEVSKLPNVSVRVQPFTAGATWGLLPGGYVILDFGTDRRGRVAEPPIVFIDGAMSGDLYIENTDIVERYRELASEIRRDTLDETSTRYLLRQVAKEYSCES